MSISQSTTFSVNMDVVGAGALAKELGEIVEVSPDCEGRARYVDVFKYNGLYNNTANPDPALHFVKDPSGELKLGRDRFGRWGFLGEKGRPDWCDINVKVYDTERFLTSIERLSENRVPFGVALTWTDPRTGLITHVFWSKTVE